MLHTVASFLVALGVLIVIHELGHFWAARACGVKVLRFSIGLGPPLFRYPSKGEGTEWVIGSLPLGGYVKMLDEREGYVAPNERDEAFNRKAVGQRFAIVAAGPIANFVLAVLLYAVLFMYGVPEQRPVLATPAIGTPAAAAGIQSGEVVVAVGDQRVSTWQDFRWALVRAGFSAQPLEILIDNTPDGPGRKRLAVPHAPADAVDGVSPESLGLRLFRPPIPAVVGTVLPDSVAARASLQIGDEILRVDDQAIADWESFVRIVRASAGREIALLVRQADVQRAVRLTPDSVLSQGQTIGRIGIGPKNVPDQDDLLQVRRQYGVGTAIALGVQRTWEMSLFSVRMMGKMLIGEVSWRNLSGPVTIADYAGQSASLGWTAYLGFLALVSVSLGVLNALPIPMLDGGYLMYYVLEIVRGKPLPERWMEYGQRVGLFLILCLTSFALFNDFNRLLAN